MNINYKWSSPIAEKSVYLTDKYRKELIRVVVTNGGNIFEHSPVPGENSDIINDFEDMVWLIINEYLAEAYNLSYKSLEKGKVIDDKYTIKIKAFGNHQTYGGRTYPHYHNHYDGVVIHYLTVGDEFKLNNNYDVIPLTEEDRIHKEVLEEGQGYYAIQGDTKYRADSKVHYLAKGEKHEEKFPLQGSGKLIVCDPRIGVNNIFSNKAIAFTPKNGMTIIHPAYLWHESNTFTGNGIRASIIIQFRVELK